MSKGVLIIILILIVLSVALYFTFIYTPKCDNLQCWETKLEKCGRASYTNDAGDVVWQYKIEGKSRVNNLNKCIVNVKLLDLRKGSVKSLRLVNKEMKCAVPFGVISYPETNSESCSGTLKEGMQSLIIEQLYQYILDNVGKIGSEIADINIFSGQNITAPNLGTTINQNSTNQTINNSGINNGTAV